MVYLELGNTGNLERTQLHCTKTLTDLDTAGFAEIFQTCCLPTGDVPLNTDLNTDTGRLSDAAVSL